MSTRTFLKRFAALVYGLVVVSLSFNLPLNAQALVRGQFFSAGNVLEQTAEPTPGFDFGKALGTADVSMLLQSYGCPAQTPSPTTQTTNAADFVLILDTSGSFKGNDPDELRIVAAKLFVDLLLPTERAAVIRFGEGARVLSDFTNDKDALKAAIEQAGNSYIQEGTRTDTSHGLAAALCQLLNRSSADARAIAVLITDGKPEPSKGTIEFELASVNSLLALFKENGWPIAPVGLCMYENGAACGPELLQYIAEQTGSIFSRAESAPELVDAYIQTLADVYGYRTISQSQKVPLEYEFFVPPDTKQLIAVSKGKIRLVPSLSSISPGESACQETDEYYVCRVSNPGVGSWKIVAVDEEVELTQLLAEVAFGVQLDINPQACLTEEPLNLQAQILDEQGAPVTNPEILQYFAGQLSVEVEDPSGGVKSIPLALQPQNIYIGQYTAEQPGKHIFRAAMGPFLGTREEKSVTCKVVPTPTATNTFTPTPTDTPTPTPTDTPTPTPTDTPMPTPTSYPVSFELPNSPYLVPNTEWEYALPIWVLITRTINTEEKFLVELNTAGGTTLYNLNLARQEDPRLIVSDAPDVCQILQQIDGGLQKWAIQDGKLVWANNIVLQVVKQSSPQGTPTLLGTPLPVQLGAAPSLYSNLKDIGMVSDTFDKQGLYRVDVRLMCGSLPIDLPALQLGERVEFVAVLRSLPGGEVASSAPLQQDATPGSYYRTFTVSTPGAYSVQAELWVDKTPQATVVLWEASLPADTPTPTPTPIVVLDKPANPLRLPQQVGGNDSYEMPVEGSTALRPSGESQVIVQIGRQTRAILAVESNGRFRNESPIDVCEELVEAWKHQEDPAAHWEVVDNYPLFVHAYDLVFSVGDFIDESLTPAFVIQDYRLEVEPELFFKIKEDDTGEVLLVGDQIQFEATLRCEQVQFRLDGTLLSNNYEFVANIVSNDGLQPTQQIPMNISSDDNTLLIGEWLPQTPGSFEVEIQMLPKGGGDPIYRSRKLYYTIEPAA